MASFVLLLAILIPLFGSIVTFAWGHKNKKTVSFVGMLFSALAFLNIIGLFVIKNTGQTLRAGLEISLPFQLALNADNLALYVALIATTLWFLVSIYSIEYIHERKGLFACFMQLSLFGMLGIIFAENLFSLLIFFEVFSVASAILVIHEMSPSAIRAGFQYLFISIVGTAAIIVGTAIIWHLVGSLDLVGEGLKTLPSKGLGVFAFWLLIGGFAVKAGMFPVHIWLPEAHPIAPSSASALLSGVMIKAGAYGIIRIIYYVYGMKSITSVSITILITLALVTMLGGSFIAIRQTELKRMLAYSSVAQIGYIILGASLLSSTALKGGVLHIMNHALMKGSLFLAAGAIIHKTGKRNLKDLKGIGRQMPLTMTVITLSAISMIGIPPFVGFFSKWFLAIGALESAKIGIIAPWASYVIIGVVILSGLLNAVYYGPILINGWYAGDIVKDAHGHAHSHDDHAHEPKEKIKLTEPTWVMTSPMIILASSTLLLGIYIKYPLKIINSIIKIYF